MKIADKIINIEKKVKTLSEELISLRAKNVLLSNQLAKLETNLSEKDVLVFELKNQTKYMQQALDKKQENEPEKTKVLRKQIDKYIEEIDKCIDWMEKA